MKKNDLIRIKIFEDNHYIIKKFTRLKIDIYDIKYNKDETIYTVNKSDLSKLSPEEYTFVSSVGPMHIIETLLSNKHFFIALLLSILIMICASKLIFKINVIHSDKEIRDIVSSELYKYGIKPLGIKKSYKELTKIKENILKDYKDKIEWIEIIESGMKYIVRIEERIITEEEETYDYCDIVSQRDAVIKSISIDRGQIVKTADEYVKPGDVIISGNIVFNEETKTYVCASGKVTGTTWYKVHISLPYAYEEKVYTGKKSSNIGLLFGSNLIDIFKVHLDKYDIKKKELFKIGSFSLIYEKNLEYKLEKKQYSKEEATKKALSLAKENLLLKLDNDAEIVSEKVLQSTSYNSIIELDIFYSVNEVISKTVKKEVEGLDEKLTE